MEKKTTKAKALQDHFVEAVPWDGNDFKQEEAKRRQEQGRGPHPEDDPVEAAYERMVDATAEWLSIQQWEECKGNPDYVGPTAQYHETWVHARLMSGDGMQFASAVSEQVQRQLSRLVEVEHNAQQYLKFFIVKRITQEQDAPKNSFSDVNFYAETIDDLRAGPSSSMRDPEDTAFCLDVAARMAEIWEVEYKGQI